MQYTLKELSEYFEVPFQGNGDLLLTHACGVDQLSPGGICYITSPMGMTSVPIPRGMAHQTHADFSDTLYNEVAIIVPPDINSPNHHLIFSEDPLALHVQITEWLHPQPEPDGNIHPNAVIYPGTQLADGVTVGPHAVIYPGVIVGANTWIHAGCVIMENVRLGRDCMIYPNVVIREECRIGDRVTIHAGAVIGSDGHGYFQRQGINIKIPQVGIVVLEDDVEIGSCTTIDRARFNQTLIRKGSKIDNQVQIAHNVDIGEQALISAQTAVGGSTKTGHHLILGGQSGIRDHMEVGDHVTVAARAVITAKTPDRSVVAGMPGRPLDEWRQTQARINRLEELFERIRVLEDSIQHS
ncbi:MAG: UDP-3-O-(3-hydroxymyristoyl)glucosamine N-acyltransferase [SAR324 cluster bacterium]|nr:UDP-3-O-(3-hydroxymyristoyl)glucosamine N-acyltransferase [SAR324 cluster bacterium]